MRRLRVLTVHFDRTTGLFDDEGLRGYLATPPFVRAVTRLLVHEGRPRILVAPASPAWESSRAR